MGRPVEEPITIPDTSPMGGTRTTHPAFAMIGASRVSGRSNLFASDFAHNAFMTVTISRAELHRSISNDWHHARGELIEIAMSEAQWATFVSSPNAGSGVPCTLQHVAGEMMPGLPDPIPRTHQFDGEMRKKLAGTVASLDALLAEIDGSGLSKPKAAAMREKAEHARMEIAANLSFVAGQFEEHMEGTVEKAKAEIHGYMTGAIMRSGIASLAGSPPLQLDAPQPGASSVIRASPAPAKPSARDENQILPKDTES